MRIIIILFLFPSFVSGVSFQIKGKILLNSSKVVLQSQGGIALLDDSSILFSDLRAGDFKFFNEKGGWIKTFGRKGEGPNEFINNCLLNYHDGLVVVMNTGKHKLGMYKISPNLDLVEIQSFGLFAFDAAIDNNNLVITRLPEFDLNKTFYSLFGLDLKTKMLDYLIPTRVTFGEKPIDIHMDQTNELQDVVAIGPNSFCDVQGSFAYMVWRGNWQIMKVDMKTKKIVRFGNKPRQYIQPCATRELKQAFKQGDYKQVEKAYQQMSWMVKIICWKEFIMVFYVTYVPNLSYWQTYMQLYNSRKELLLERKLDELHSLNRFVSIHMNKKTGRLAGLAHDLDSMGEDRYQIMEYSVE